MEEYKNIKRTEMQEYILQDYYNHPEFTAFSPGFAFTIDHILFRNTKENGERGHVHLVQLLELPTRKDIDYGAEPNSQQCPSYNLPSDHLRIEALFQICL